ncbi:MAG: hypothetical protein FJX53_11955 [Alphaproteobacteria bacterium]|nr:hypothetical protein [Alphaproteobacteria bacterium]
MAAGVLFACTAAMLSSAAAWAIISMLDLPRWLAAPFEVFAVLFALGVGVLAGWMTWHRERQMRNGEPPA